jgi:hypothetical protein
MSQNVAVLIAEFAGADKRQLLENSQPDKPRNHWSEPLTKEWLETEYKTEVDKQTVDGYVGFLSFQIQIALDACATMRPKEVHTVMMAFTSAIAEIPERFQLQPMIRELMTKFVYINFHDPLAAEKIKSVYGSPTARAQDYAELEERRALKAQSAKKPRRQAS